MTELPANHQIGANNPPSLVETLLQKHAALFNRASALIEAKDRLPQQLEIDDEEALAKTAEMVRLIREADKALDTARAQEKKPFDDDAKTVQTTFNTVRDKLSPIKARCEQMIVRRNAAYETHQRAIALQAAEAQRAAENERLASAARLETIGHDAVAKTVLDSAQQAGRSADKMERMAAGATTDLVRTQTTGGTVSASSKDIHTVIDNAALRATLGPLGEYFTAPEIDKAIRAFMAANKRAGRANVLAGVEFGTEAKAIVR
jgi:hypothetical protein